GLRLPVCPRPFRLFVPQSAILAAWRFRLPQSELSGEKYLLLSPIRDEYYVRKELIRNCGTIFAIKTPRFTCANSWESQHPASGKITIKRNNRRPPLKLASAFSMWTAVQKG